MKYLLLILAGVMAVTLNAQNLLNGPEGVTRDEGRQRYLVANYSDNNVIAIDRFGVQSVFAENTTQPLGVLAYDGTLYVTGNNPPTLYGFDLEDGTTVFSVGIDNCLACAEICTDENGYLYIADQGGKVHRVSIETLESEVWLDSGLPGGPQGVAYDRENQRIVVAGYAGGSPIKAFGIEDQTATTLIGSAPGQFIQIYMESHGKVFLSSWNGNRVFWFQPGVVDELQVLSDSIVRPSGLYANEETNQLAVVSFSNSQIFYLMISNENDDEPLPESVQTISVSPNPFNPQTRISYQIEQTGDVELTIYNVRGQRVRVLVNRYHDAGNYDIVWDGRDFDGRTVSSGVYTAILKTAVRESCSKMLMMK